MATFDLRPIRNGVQLTLVADDHATAVSEDFDQRRGEQFVRMFCQSAGLPEPWKQG